MTNPKCRANEEVHMDENHMNWWYDLGVNANVKEDYPWIEDSIAVRCCSGDKGYSPTTCPLRKTWQDARDVCLDLGYDLCTLDQIYAN